MERLPDKDRSKLAAFLGGIASLGEGFASMGEGMVSMFGGRSVDASMRAARNRARKHYSVETDPDGRKEDAVNLRSDWEKILGRRNK